MPHHAGPDTDFLRCNRYRRNVLSGQFAASSVPIDEQSALPKFRGLPWWGAVAFAVVLTAVGAGVDAMRVDALATTYQVLYLVGCVGAAFLVRRRALFTTAVQPPLIALVVSVITLYTLNSGTQMSAKTLVFKLALPIASSFPSMAVTFVLTLAVVAARWFISRRQSAARKPAKAAAKPTRSRSKQPEKVQQKSGSRSRTAQSRGTEPRRAAPRSEDERTTVPRRRRAAETPGAGGPVPAASGPAAPATGRRRADRAEATGQPVRPADPRQRPAEPRQPRPRPRPQGESLDDQSRPQRPRQAQQGPAPRRTAGAAARAAGLDLTADLGDDPSVRRRPPTH